MKRKHLSGTRAYTLHLCDRTHGPPRRHRLEGSGRAAAPDTETKTPMNAPLPEHIRKALETVTLDDKYSLDYGRAFMSGVQALVKLPMLQRARDAIEGLNTA